MMVNDNINDIWDSNGIIHGEWDRNGIILMGCCDGYGGFHSHGFTQ